MNILHISDTHGYHGEFPDDRFDGIDIVIHSGDCSNQRNPYMNEHEVRNFIEWYRSVPVKHKIFVAGNHDTSLERRMVTPISFWDNGITYLENDSVTIDGVKFWGSPVTPTFGDWAFMKARNKTHRLWESIPADTDVLITHGPPKGVRDLSYDRDGNLEMCGDSALAKWIYKNKPKLVLFGHIHDMDGVRNQGVSKYSMHPSVFSNGACVTDGRQGLSSYGNVIKEGI